MVQGRSEVVTMGDAEMVPRRGDKANGRIESFTSRCSCGADTVEIPQLRAHVKMSGKYVFTKGLKELRFLHCQTSEHSNAIRYSLHKRDSQPSPAQTPYANSTVRIDHFSRAHTRR